MATFNIIRKEKITNRIITSSISFFLLIVNSIYVSKNIYASNYDVLFYCHLTIVALSALFLLRATVWGGAKTVFEMDNTKVISKLSGSKFTFDWVEVSAINIHKDEIIFLLNGEKRQRKINLQTVNFAEGSNMIYNIKEIANEKNIVVK